MRSTGEAFLVSVISDFFGFFRKYFKVSAKAHKLIAPAVASLIVALISYIPIGPFNELYNVNNDDHDNKTSPAVGVARKAVHAAMMALSVIITNYIIDVTFDQVKTHGNLGFGKKARKSRRAATRVSRTSRPRTTGRKSRGRH